MICLSVLPSALADVSAVMRVVNCQEWVSLRLSPDTSSKRLAKVYLGELVTNCAEGPDGFVFCEYGGTAGYILGQYLSKTALPYDTEILPNQMVVNCQEWVSLRSGPSDGASRLTTVPLGAIVRACYRANESYICCEYGGTRGYIASGYLKKANYTVSARDESVVAAAAGKYTAVSGTMEVVRCADWVSLREKASSSSARLARVPLGTRLEDCVRVSDRFVYCCYRGVWGYVDIEYLEPIAMTGTEFDSLPAIPTRAEFESVGTQVLLFNTDPGGGVTVSVRRAASWNGEAMCAMFFGVTGEYLGRLTAASSGAAELTALEAFASGTEYDRKLIWLSDSEIACYGANPEGSGMDLEWTLQRRGAWWSIGGSACFASGEDGTVYLCGYHDSAPVCISPDGIPLWRAENGDPDIYWPYEIVVRDYGIDVCYEQGGEGGKPAVLSFDRDGGVYVPEKMCVSAAEAVEEESDGVVYTYFTDMEGIRTCVIFTCVSQTPVTDFKILSLEGSELDSDGSLDYVITEKMTLARLDPGETVGAWLCMEGLIPLNAVSFRDADGVFHRYIVDISGENGDVFMSAF